MPITLEPKNGGKVLEVHVRGRLAAEDYRKFVPEFERLLAARGKISVLLHMKDFHGWKPGALWEDIKFDVKHFSDIERIAMVGEKKWQKAMSQFCRPFTTAKVRYFDATAMDEAQGWLGIPESSPETVSWTSSTLPPG